MGQPINLIMRKAIIVISIFVVFIYLLLWIAPYFVMEHFNKHSEKYIGRRASIEKLSFNPFTFALHATNFKILEKESTTEFLGFRELYVNLNLLKRLGGVYQVEEILLDSPFVNVISYGGSFNFDDLLHKDSAEAEADEPTEEIAFEILNFRLRKGEVKYQDELRDQVINIDDLEFHLPRFAYNSQSANMDLQFVINETGYLSINNNFFPQEDRLECNLKLAGLDLKIAKPYVSDYVAFNDLKGDFGADLNINILLKDTTDIFLSGGSWLSEVSLTDTTSTEYFRMDSMYTRLNNIDVFGEEYELGYILVNGMYLRYDAFDSTTSLDEALAPLYARQNLADTLMVDSSEMVSSDTVSDLKYRIDTVLIVDSWIQYHDYTLEENFEYNITDITALATTIRSDSSKAIFSSNGVLNEVGKYNANLTLPPNDPLNFELDFSVDGFRMGDISPFTITYAGHPIFAGDLVYKGHTSVNNGILESENKVVVYDLEVGDKVEGNFLVSVPLKFAVFLLKDKDGVVNLDIPLEGNTNDPQFKVGPLIWQIVKQNLEKAVAAPGKILANRNGIDPKEIQFIPFAPLDTSLNEAGENTLTQLSRIIAEKPELRIELFYYEPSNIEVQTYAYKMAKENYVKAKLKYRIEEEYRNLVSKTDDRDQHFVNYMNEVLGANSANTDSLALALVGQENVISKTSQLPTYRENAVKKFISQSDSVHIENFIFPSSSKIPDFPVETSGFIVGFSIE